MQIIDSISRLRQHIQAWRQQGQRIAFVPTMGNLHAGHLALVEHARQLGDKVVVSIFVNPLQFGPNDDFDRYPRTPAEDAARLEVVADVLFVPTVDEMYPQSHSNAVHIDVPDLSEHLCGINRPDHFKGVATIVAKLFNLVEPDLALFGEKDYQQLQIIKAMVADLCFPVDVIGVATVRAADGLALSSRNAYLDAEERKQAPQLYGALQQVASQLAAGERDFAVLETAGMQALQAAGFEPEYFAIRSSESLLFPAAGCSEVVILAAAKLGNTRLIDNLRQSLLK